MVFYQMVDVIWKCDSRDLAVFRANIQALVTTGFKESLTQLSQSFIMDTVSINLFEGFMLNVVKVFPKVDDKHIALITVFTVIPMKHSLNAFDSKAGSFSFKACAVIVDQIT